MAQTGEPQWADWALPDFKRGKEPGGLSFEPENDRYKFVIEQGDFIHRPSRINLDVKGEAGRVEEVKVGGPSVLVARGEVNF